MATAERPPAKIDGKPNPAYQAWYRALKRSEKASAGPETLTLRCMGQAKNPRYVCCDLDGVKVYVSCKKSISHRLRNKTITVAVTEEDGEKIYTHVHER